MVLQVPEVLSVMFLWAGGLRVLLVDPKISLFECNKTSSSGANKYEEEFESSDEWEMNAEIELKRFWGDDGDSNSFEVLL